MTPTGLDWSPAQLGQAVRAARSQQRLSISELARRSGLSQSFLSQVESGQSDISVGRLIRVAQVLGVPLTELLEAPAPPEGAVVRATERVALPSPAPGLRLELLAPSLDSARTYAFGTLDAGALTRQRNDNPGSEAFVFLIDGAARIELTSGEPVALQPGDSVSYRSEDFVAMANVHDDQTTFLWVQSKR